ncbi:MAG: hypothetical protein KGJ55_00385 [Gammaproteobacteria bacterium]|nr:hypothetical protein [Gammaproteobacteria bacterium]
MDHHDFGGPALAVLVHAAVRLTVTVMIAGRLVGISTAEQFAQPYRVDTQISRDVRQHPAHVKPLATRHQKRAQLRRDPLTTAKLRSHRSGRKRLAAHSLKFGGDRLLCELGFRGQ